MAPKETEENVNNSVYSDNLATLKMNTNNMLLNSNDHPLSLNNSISSFHNKTISPFTPQNKSLFQSGNILKSPTSSIPKISPKQQQNPTKPGNFYSKQNMQSITNQEAKLSQMSIQEITNQLQSIARKQIGCRYLQRLITSTQEDIVNKYFFPYLYPSKLLDLCQDFFGNYFIQKLIPYLSQENLSSLCYLSMSHFVKLSNDAYGTRVIQTLNSQLIKYPTLLSNFTDTMKPCLPQLINDHNGSFVLLNYALVVPYPQNEIIYNFLKQNIVKVSTSPNACCTLQKCIDIANDSQRDVLLNTIADHSMYLVSNQFGNYVIQFALTKQNINVNDKIATGLMPNIVFLSKQKYSSNVIEKCFDYCSTTMKEMIINKICDENIIRTLLRDMYGNYVLQKAILNSSEKIKQFFLNVIIKDIGNLQYLTFGQKLITKLILTFPELRTAINFNFIPSNPPNGNFNPSLFQLNQQMNSLSLNHESNFYPPVNNNFNGINNNIKNRRNEINFDNGNSNNIWNIQQFNDSTGFNNYPYNI